MIETSGKNKASSNPENEVNGINGDWLAWM